MQSRYHILISGIVALVPLFYNLPMDAILFFLAGVLIDADHEIDYYIKTKHFSLRFTELGEDLDKIPDNRYFCPLHSLELVTLMFLYGVYPIIGASILMHIMMDALGNNVDLSSFFVIRRWCDGWKVRKIWEKR